MAWQNDFTKKFPVFPKIHAPLSHGKVLKCSWPLSLVKVRKQESTPPKGICARKGFVQTAQQDVIYFVQKREKEISKKLLTSEHFGGKLDLSSRTETKARHFEN